MSIGKLTAGSGYRYLLRHISQGDAPDLTGDAMTRYYTSAGYPPGIWLGRGLAGLADGSGLAAGSVVSEEQMARLFGAGRDPVTDQALGRPYVTTPPLAQRIATAIAELPNDLSYEARDAKIAAITAAEKAKPARGSVAGFDLIFSVPKSVSVLWALSDADVQRAIVDAHHAAVAVTLGLIERDVARTRTGHAGAARIPVRGLIPAGFDHHDSRAGDPQLHTHLLTELCKVFGHVSGVRPVGVHSVSGCVRRDRTTGCSGRAGGADRGVVAGDGVEVGAVPSAGRGGRSGAAGGGVLR